MADVVVVGSLNMDLVVRTPHLPVPGETILGHGFTTVAGGKGANQAVGAAKLGAKVTMVGRVGFDDFGHALIRNLQASGIDTSCVLADRAAATGVAVIEVDDGGQNTIVVASGANMRVTRTDVEAAREAITSAHALIVQLEIPPEAVGDALGLAHQAHVMTILNPAPARLLAPEVYPLADVIAPNETEAALLTGLTVTDWATAEAAARELQRRGPRVVIVTLGARGALVLDHDGARPIPTFQVNVVDTTAAGDAFIAAFAVARAEGRDLGTALREASAAGALATTKLGAQPSLPTRAELDAFLSAKG